jgi:crotonobetainyl-CoA:carnitine CoA-transferase CaiB-like acyl-CoA transferase
LKAIIGNRTAGQWREVFEGEDCAANIVRTLDEASKDPHFIERGLFDFSMQNEDGANSPALVVPVVPQFRSDKTTPRRAPALGANNETVPKQPSDEGRG